MRVVLKNYQSEAAREILKALGRTKRDWHEDQELSSFALSAPTSSGKTVIAAASIEATILGSDEFGIDPDPTAVFLWVSKDPSLNAQTLARFKQHANRIPLGALVTLDKDYARESLQTGTINFINPQKLAVSSGFVRTSDTRHVTFWDILTNTIGDPKKTLYMVLDEAHEGMRPQTSSDQTIVMKIINGNGDNPPMPIVWGISATLDRFTKAMASSTQRVNRPNIVIDPVHVQASGLIKTAIHLDLPDEAGEFTTALIRDATLDFVDVCRRWDEYTQAQSIDERVYPLMVVQIPNRADGQSSTDKAVHEEEQLIHLVLETIRQHWPDMPTDGIAHVLGESRGAIAVGSYVIPRIEPQLVQQETDVRILIAKDAISTGWDCPRAEVLISLRPGKDPTYVTQLIGRMVRTPLAQSTSVDRLNTASAYLPKFDLATTLEVVNRLLGKGKNADTGSSTSLVQNVLLKPVTLGINTLIPADVVDLIESLPSYARPTAAVRPIKRLLKAAQAFAQDGLVPDANVQAHQTLYGVLDGIVAQHREALGEEALAIRTADIRRISVDMVNMAATDKVSQREADANTIDDALRHLRRLLTKAVVNGYLGRDVEAAIAKAEAEGGGIEDIDLSEIRSHVAAIGLLETAEGQPSVQDSIEKAAETLTQQWLNMHAGNITGLSDSRRSVYEELRGMARVPERAPIELKREGQVDTVDEELNKLPSAERHVLADASGNFPLDVNLNRWERAAIEHELTYESIIGWYRNPSVASRHSLRIPYESGKTWKTVQPDLIFVSQHDDGMIRPSIIDPHGAHLADALPKLKALAHYAGQHGDKFERIIAVGGEKDGHLIAIDMLDATVVAKVYQSPADKASVEALFAENGKKYAPIA